MSKIYGYLRISQKSQSIERQERNIIAEYPNAKLVKEAYTGTKVEGREEFIKLLNKVKEGDTIVFDSVSRMSRNAQEGVELYEKLFEEGINLVFLKEPHINTETYKRRIEDANIPNTENKAIDAILDGIKVALKELAKDQVRLAFEQSEKEVMDLRQRTREGIETARRNGKQIGSVKGSVKNTKRGQEIKEAIRRYSKDFGGALKDKEIMEWKKIGRNAYYKYKRELLEATSKGE